MHWHTSGDVVGGIAGLVKTAISIGADIDDAEEDSKANAALKSVGVPIGVGPVSICNAFGSQLDAKMASVWN